MTAGARRRRARGTDAPGLGRVVPRGLPPAPTTDPMLRFLLAGLVLAPAALAQTHDQDLSWRTYSSERSARVRVFPAESERRPRTVVIDDRASNGQAITDEAVFIADLVGRELGFDPVAATFVFRFTPAAFAPDAPEQGKTLLLRATFGRTASGALGSAQWRVISSDEMEELTDRTLR